MKTPEQSPAPPADSGRRSKKLRILLLLAFLVGLIPPVIGLIRVYGDLRNTRQELQVVRQDLSLNRARALAGQIYLETSRNNFGLAGQAANQLFAESEQLARTLPDERRQPIQYVLDQRSKLNEELAAANGNARVTAEQILAALQPLR